MALSFLLSLAPLAIIILVFAVMKIKPDEDGDDLVRSLYVYLVLFATLMMVIGGSIGVFTSVADILAPAPYHQSFEEFRKWGDGERAFKDVPDEQIRILYEDMIEMEISIAKQRAVNTLFKSFGWIVIPLPVFIFFQRRLAVKNK